MATSSKEVAVTETRMAVGSGFAQAAQRLIAAGNSGNDFAAQLERTISAASSDELFGESQAISAEDYVGVPFTIQSVKLQESDEKYKAGMPCFAVVFATDDHGNALVITSGSGKVLAQLIRATELDIWNAEPETRYEFKQQDTPRGTMRLLIKSKRPVQSVKPRLFDDEPF